MNYLLIAILCTFADGHSLDMNCVEYRGLTDNCAREIYELRQKTPGSRLISLECIKGGEVDAPPIKTGMSKLSPSW